MLHLLFVYVGIPCYVSWLQDFKEYSTFEGMDCATAAARQVRLGCMQCRHSQSDVSRGGSHVQLMHVWVCF